MGKEDTSVLDNRQLLESIHKLAQGMDNGPIKQIPIAKYKPVTPWNPKGRQHHERPRLKRTVYMGGNRLREIFLRDEEIRLLNKLKAGKYNGRRWVILEAGDEREGGSITILVPNRTPEDRIRLKGEAPSLEVLLRRIVEEQEANEAQQSATRRRVAPDEQVEA